MLQWLRSRTGLYQQRYIEQMLKENRALKKQLLELNNGQPIDQAIQTAYGLTSLQLESGWRTQLRAAPSFSQTIDPGSFGTSIIITCAMLVTATVLTVRWLRRDRAPAIYDE